MKRILTGAVVAALVLAMAVPAVGIAKPGRAFSKPRPVAAKRVFGKPIFVSHPFTKRDTVKAGQAFTAWGYINTWHGVALTTDATVTVRVQKWKGGRSWETSAGLATTATLAPSGKFKRKTNYTAGMNIGLAGRYRLVAVLVWKDAKGVQRTTCSSWKYIRVK